MGRWFGYREGYKDICQIWMSENAINWYEYISVASDELRREVMRMKDQNKTPKDFGLRVRSDIVTLLVTARNKMKTAMDYTRTVSLNGKMVETPYLHLSNEILERNIQHTESFINLLKNDGYLFEVNPKLALHNLQIKNVPKDYICNYLKLFQSHYLNMDFQTDNLVASIQGINSQLVEKWDIVLASGKGKKSVFCGHEIGCIMRGFAIKKESAAIQISGKNSRLGDKNYAKGGLSKEEIEKIESIEREYQSKIGRKDTFSQDTYFRSAVKRNPLLVIYPVQLDLNRIKNDSKNTEESGIREAVANLHMPIVGLSIGIPILGGEENISFKYKINKVAKKRLLEYLEADQNYEEETEEQDN